MGRKDFYIPQIPDENSDELRGKEQEKKVKPEGFVSSIYGKNVVGNTYYPGVKYSNQGRQYDSFREKDKRVVKDNYKDYLIPKDIFANKKSPLQQNNIQESNVNEPDPSQYSIHQEFTGYEEEDNEYYEENIEKEEYVNVKNNNNSDYNNNIRDYNNNIRDYNNNIRDYNNNSRDYNNNISDYNNNYFNDNDYSANNDSRGNINNSNNYSQNNSTPEKVTIRVDNGQNNYKQVRNEPIVKQRKRSKYVAPPISVLKLRPEDEKTNDSEQISQRNIIDVTLKQFDIGGHVVNYTKGPTVTQFEVQLDDGVRNQKIIPIQSNLQGNLKATSIRMQIPIPLKSTIGIEVPNINRETIYFGDLINNKKFLNDGNPLNVVLGVGITGEPVYLDIPKMPHGLIAGQTGSGKSVCINAIIASILYKAHPDDVKLILVDPKRVEFSKYAGIPHLATPIITEPKMANAALKWVVDEMENRYRLFEATGVTKYSEYLDEAKSDNRMKYIPYIVVIIDELADLMMTSGPEVEESILRITQKARAAGIHLIVATQRPSVNIISGTIKTNIPTRIAFKVGKAIDSNIILDRAGAEKLLGQGDMLYIDDLGVENRIQGAFISSGEIKQVVQSLENYNCDEYLFTEDDLKKKTIDDNSNDALHDELFEDIARYVVINKTASINLLQKKFSCGFSRIQAIIIKLGELGVVSENLGSRAREVLVNITELEEILSNI